MRVLSIALSVFAISSLAACADEEEAATETETETSTELVVTAELEAAAQTGQNTLLVTVVDDLGDFVADATVTVDPQMPMMGHGSTEDPVVTNNEDGTYTATPVTFQMAGPWVVTIGAVRGDQAGTLVYSVDVP